jgi:hypothetical protein
MERVAFLLEQSGARLGCLLNPEGLIMRRTAGVHPRRTLGGQLTGARLADDPLLYTGGGMTELRLDLLFDVTLAGSSIQSEDVRDLTRPLWDLAENTTGDDGSGRPPQVRFVWGKSWNIPGVVAAVAERLEYFTPEGAPRRSWLRMRLLRLNEPATRATAAEALGPAPFSAEDLSGMAAPGGAAENAAVHAIIGGGGETPAAESAPEETGAWTERLDELANRYYGDPSYWRALAAFNDIDDPLHLLAGGLLRIPPLSAWAETR